MIDGVTLDDILSWVVIGILAFCALYFAARIAFIVFKIVAMERKIERKEQKKHELSSVEKELQEEIRS